MQFIAGQLAALAAVVREGSFERAARALHVTASAVSQRIRQLEEQVGAVLVVRGSPCTPTEVGEAVYRHARQVEMLERDLLHTLDPARPRPKGKGAAPPPMSLAIAVNADSLATWVIPALVEFSATAHVRVDLCIDDEDDTTGWLRSGRVLGAVTSQARAVQGCRVQRLGVMRYVASASPRFVRRHLPRGPSAAALAGAPALAYNRKDDLCAQFLARRLRARDPRLHHHFVPSPQAYLEACLHGLAWGMNPYPLAAPALRRRRLVELVPGRDMMIPLYWQQWSISSPTVDALADALRRHAEAALGASAARYSSAP